MSSTTKVRSALLRGASLGALGLALHAPALAQAPQQTAAAQVEEIVVTGSRLAISGFTAPTPVTTVTQQDLTEAAPTNLADGLNKLPVFLGSIVTNFPTTTTQPGATAGQNLLSLRRLGSGRTLVLLDGRRMVATNGNGSTDVDIFPQSLVARVDVVTGGASAAYGSDAVAGVVNFVLDTRFVGAKGEAKTGISDYGDLQSYSVNAAFGTGFGGGRGHFIFSADYFSQDGLGADKPTGRKWFDTQYARVPNPAGTNPARIIITNARTSNGSPGGLITSGPLKGTQFIAGGATAPFNYGTSTGTAFQSGGDGGQAWVGLKPDEHRYNVFGHAEYDMTDALQVFIEGLYARSYTNQNAFYNIDAGTSNQFTVFNDNAYLSAAVKAQMAALKITSFTLGRIEQDMPITTVESRIDVYRTSLGLKGDLGGSWKFDASYTYSRSRQFLNEGNLTIARPLYASADAVINPANGQIVCRSTLQGLDQGCVPHSLFGPQTYTQQQLDYFTGDSFQTLTQTQNVIAANINGDLGDSLQFGAGPIALATGAEYRSENAVQTSDPLSQTFVDFTGIRGGPASLNGKLGPYRHNNPQPFSGKYNIKEAYAELGVPLAKDMSFARSLDMNGAVRVADYSTGAGTVTTWKFGANWLIIDDIRARFTRSRDIRGANTLELFNPISQITNNTVYQGRSVSTLNIMSGNINLRPETADTLTFGAVLQPRFLPGLSMSLDYYDIDMKDAISSIGSQTIIDQCAAGNQALCAQLTVTPQNTLIVRNQTLNLDKLKNAGYDFEAAYTTPLGEGDLTVRTLVNRRTKDYNRPLGLTITDNLNNPSSPKWRGTVSVRYTTPVWSVFVQTRWQEAGPLDPTQTIDINHVPAITYTDVTGAYKFELFGARNELYLSIANAFNQSPPISAGNVSTFTRSASPAYDPVGRYFTMGIRTRF